MSVPRAPRARQSGALQMQQQAMVQLIVGGVIMALLCAGSAFVYVVGFGPSSMRNVPPLLAAFMRAGAEGDVLAGHSLFSDEGLRISQTDRVSNLFAERDRYEQFDYVRVESFRTHPASSPGRPETATVVATVYYTDGRPGRIDAELDLDPRGWRIRAIQVVRAEP